MGKIKDLTGIIFPSGVKALEFVELRNHMAYWKCQCPCGNIFITRGADLANGTTKSCGCLQKAKAKQMGMANKNKTIKDITNQRFGSLVALKPTEKRDSGRNVIWKCQCDCGNILEISGHALRQGQTSCGCGKSRGEAKIAQLLIEAGIPFETQKTFETCRFPDTNALAKFDFYVNNQYLIEYDGIQHYDERFGWNSNEAYNKIKFRDSFKDQWCNENKIPLIRIPYTKFNSLNLQDILL